MASCRSVFVPAPLRPHNNRRFVMPPRTGGAGWSARRAGKQDRQTHRGGFDVTRPKGHQEGEQLVAIIRQRRLQNAKIRYRPTEITADEPQITGNMR